MVALLAPLALASSLVSFSRASPAVAAPARFHRGGPHDDRDAVATCCRLLRDSGLAVTLPGDAAYVNLTDANWSQTAWQHPSCIASPESAAQVAELVGLLGARSVPFAVRSGGHSPNPLDAAINTGVLVSLSGLDAVSYDSSTGLAAVGPGARWEAVYSELDKYRVTVVGGRVVPVGVGGLVLGGGLSYLTDLYGLACDNVVSYEVVLANGRVVEASVHSHPDLFWALKGGLNNFGIVTKFRLATYPIYEAWGGVMTFDLDQMPALLHSLYEYQTTPNKDLYANLVINLVPTNRTLLLTLVYLKPEERPSAFAPFYGLRSRSEQLGFMTLHRLMALFPPASVPRWTWYTHSSRPSDSLYAQLSTLLTTAPEVKDMSALQAGSLVVALQPISASAVLAGRQSNDGTGNALGLRAVNQTWLSISGAWGRAADDARARPAIRGMWRKIGSAIAGDQTGLGYLFMNDANIEQPVIQSYGAANVARLQAVRHRYDPDLVFDRLVPGGQKIPET
ncbi:hypothetical protein CDD83_7805 [Cordyceps sp. RAO-2017]|nr:hypothetical protein CDD83_7805 [Cordyceps sp. RAO-2017]